MLDPPFRFFACSHSDNNTSIFASSSSSIVRVFKSDAVVPEPMRDVDNDDAAATRVM